MSTTPLRVTVYPNLKIDGASGDPFFNSMLRSMQQTSSATSNSQNQDKDGWNPFNMFQLPNFGLNMNMLWLLAAVLIFAALIINKRGK